MNQPDDSSQLPAFLQSISGEVDSDYWKPQNVKEWSEVRKTSAFIAAWEQQQNMERALRKAIGIWVFILITLQVIAVFTLVTLDALKLLLLNEGIIKLLIPSVLAEVFGMGFIVIKYLFRPAAVNPLEFGKRK
jgi:hypothetical protein